MISTIVKAIACYLASLQDWEVINCPFLVFLLKESSTLDIEDGNKLKYRVPYMYCKIQIRDT